MERDEPDRLYIRERDREAYNEILGLGSPLKGQENKVAFLMAMLVGFTEGRSSELGPKKEGYILSNYLSEREKTIMKAIAVSTKKNLEILSDKKEVYAISERFAAGGVDLLRSMIQRGGLGSYEKKLELQLSETLTRAQEQGERPTS